MHLPTNSKNVFDQEASQSLIVQIDNEVQKKQTASYKSDGESEQLHFKS